MIEPEIIYTDVNGVKDFARFVRFDEDETLTDTNEIQYGVTQRLYFREGEGGREITFDPIFTPETELPNVRGGRLTETRAYRAAHNVGHFRFFECGNVDGAGRPGALLI